MNNYGKINQKQEQKYLKITMMGRMNKKNPGE